jgi:hypothetical protein
MVQEPDPPEVTIVDPNAPPGTADLLDSDRDPWRPSRAQAVVLGVVVVTAALVLGVTAEVRHARHERALDAAAVRAVAFFVDSSAGEADGKHETLALINEGPAPVRVLDVAFVGEGYATGPVDADAVKYQTVTVAVPLGTRCPTTLLAGGPTRLQVRARTARGTVLTRVVDLDPREVQQLGGSERARCGLLRVEEALDPEVGATRLRADGLEVTLVIANHGLLPVTVSEVTAFDGMLAGAVLPMRLAGRPANGPTPRASLGITLSVLSCDRIAEKLFDNPVFETDGRMLGPSTVALSAANPYRSGDVLVDVDAPGQPFPGEVTVSPVSRLLQRSCPHTPGLG